MPTSKIPTASRDQVLAFRLDSHNLAARLPAGSLLAAAGACGLQNTPPGSAALALHARLAGLTPREVNQALVVDKTLLQVWSLRASPYVFPTADVAVFTRGLLPEDEDSTRFFIYGVEAALEKIGVRASEVVAWTAAALLEELDGRELTKDELGVALASRLSAPLTAQQRTAWQSPSWYAPGQSLGESVVRFALPVVALQGLCCHAGRRDNKAYLMRTDQWLEAPQPEANVEQARGELVRRYLHCYGPSTVKHFAEWAGISPVQAAGAWKLVEGELVEIGFDGRKTWLLQQDLERFSSPPAAKGIRFLPPSDPYLQQRDRATLVPDKALQRQVWRSSGSPGAVLENGRFATTWRSQKKGRRLHVTLELLAPISASVRSAIEAEAATLAPYKNCETVEVEM